jgi:serine/threonine protein kinase/tetratricopeptide (TPR) repeat protein
LPAGTVINGRYEIHSLIGQGGMGIVYRASDRVYPNRKVALKAIQKARLNSNFVSFFKGEFGALTRLHHPNLAQAYDFEAMEEDGNHFFTLEYVDGENLYAATEGKRWQEVLPLLVQVCRALSYIHSRGIIHFDLKPANIFVDRQGQIKLLDFGLVGAKTRIESGNRFGTPTYMAPELLVLGQPLDHRVDLYSLGIMAFHLLCRREPFRASSRGELFQKHAYEALQFDEAMQAALPAWLRAQIEKLCEKNPADRFPSANAVIEAFNREGGQRFEIETVETKGSYILSSRFVGRQSEFDRAMQIIRHGLDGDSRRPKILLVGGMSGVGKSRLTREARFHVQLSRASFVEGNSYEGAAGQNSAFAEALSELLRRASALDEKLSQRFGPEVVKLCPELAPELGITASAPLPDAEADALRLLEQTSRFCLELAERFPYVLCLGDLHWADSATLRMLSYLARRLLLERRDDKRPLISIVGTYRDDEIHGRPLERLIYELEALDGVELLHLRPLEPEQVSELLSSMLGVKSLPQAFAARVAHETGGNPFFVEEVMRTLVENGSVYLDGGAWAAREAIDELEIPPSVAAVFLRRAEMLEPQDRELLDVLAVCSRPTRADVIAQAAEMELVSAHRSLAALQRRQMVSLELALEPEYRVGHDRIRETLYANMPEQRRHELHRRVAVALASSGGGDAHAELLAYHYSRAERWADAARYAESAARQAEKLGRFADSLRAFEQAYEWLEKSDGASGEKIALLREQERLAEKVGARDKQQGLIHRLFSLLSPDDPLHASILVRQGDLDAVCGRYDAAAAALGRALTLAQSRPNGQIETVALRSLAFLHWRWGKQDEAVRYSEWAVENDRNSGDKVAYARDLINLGMTLRAGGHIDRASACLNEALSLQESNEDPIIRAQALHLQSNVYHDLGLEEERLECQRRVLEIEDRHGMVQYKAITLSWLAGSYFRKGQVEESLELYGQLLVLAREASLAPEMARALAALGEVFLSLGRLEEATTHLLDAAAVFARVGDASAEAAVWEKLGPCYEKQGGAGVAAATDAWRRAAALRGALGDGARQLDALCRGARAARRDAALREEARMLFREALKLAEASDDRARRGDLLNSWAILEWESGDYEDALSHYVQAMEVFKALDDKVHLGLVLNSLGATLQKLGRRGEARARLFEAIELNRHTREKLLEGHGYSALGDLETEDGNFEAARGCFEKSLELRRAAGDRRGEGWMLHRLASVLARTGDSERARGVAAQAGALAEELKDSALADACQRAQGLIKGA